MRENYNPTKSPYKLSTKINTNKYLQGKDHSNNLLSSSNRLKDLFKKFILPKDNIMQAVLIVEWRCRTSLPIIRVAQYVVSPQMHVSSQKPVFRSETPNKNNLNNSEKMNKTSTKINEFIQKNQDIANYELKVKAEEIRCRLSDVGMMPFSQSLHLLKEMLIGFEALFDIFGSFEVKQQLIAINNIDQWCMWIDEDYCNNLKTQNKIQQRQLIYKLILIAQKHSLQTIQSRYFYSLAKQSTYQSDCSFVKMMQKLNQFININKIYIPSKVSVLRQGQKTEGKIQKTKNNLNKIINPSIRGTRQQLFRKRKQSCQTFYAYNHSATNLSHTFNINSNQLRAYPSCSDLKKGFLQKNKSQTPVSPSSPLINAHKNLSFQGLCQNWNNNYEKNNQQSNISLKIINHSPIKKRPQVQYSQGERQSYNFTALPSTRIQSSPIFYLSRPKHFKKNDVEKPIVKPVSQLHQPVKRANIRKYSQQLTKFKSADNLLGKFQNSTVSNNFFEKEKESSSLQKQKPSRNDPQTPSQSSQGIILSSPNNSSSTKEIGNSGQMDQDERKSAYRSMKMKDLAPHRKNNQSLINYNFHDTNNKNMTASYQFKRGDAQSDSQSQSPIKPPKQQWINKISDLFSDTVSIKQLKGSIKFKTKQQQIFQKDYLKDVKLDKLQKFGRSVTLHCQEQGDFQPRIGSKNNQYKSMQLIEQQIQEVKSYQQDERRQDQITAKSIRSIRSRRQTQGYVDKQISFKDEFVPFEEGQKTENPFNFEPQMYSIRSRRAT